MILSVRGVSKWFGEAPARTDALRDISFNVDHNEMLYIVGPSGSGKTTLLSVISGILRPNAGTVLVEDKDIWRFDADSLADFRLHTLGFVFQDYHLFPRLTTLENIAVPLILRRVPWEEGLNKARQVLEIVELKDKAELTPNRLSGGEQQRVAIARALAPEPSILIADEPTGNLDADTGREIIRLMFEARARRGATLVLVTHDRVLADACDRRIVMRSGEIVEDVRAGGTP